MQRNLRARDLWGGFMEILEWKEKTAFYQIKENTNL